MIIADEYRKNYIFLFDCSIKDQLWEALRRDKEYRSIWNKYSSTGEGYPLFQKKWGLETPCDPYGKKRPSFYDKRCKGILEQHPRLAYVSLATKIHGNKTIKTIRPIAYDIESLIEALATFDLHNGEYDHPTFKGKKLSLNKIAERLHPNKANAHRNKENPYLKPGAENLKASQKLLKKLCTRSNLVNSNYFAEGFRLMNQAELEIEHFLKQKDSCKKVS